VNLALLKTSCRLYLNQQPMKPALYFADLIIPLRWGMFVELRVTADANKCERETLLMHM